MHNEELEIEREVESMLMGVFLDSMDNRKHPGTYIKRHRNLFPLIDKMKSRHFNHEWFVKKLFKK